MSTALIRGNMLTQLANRGESACEAVEQLVREFLSDLPGPWLPEEFFAPHELVERSIQDANDDGRRTLLRALHLLINELFVEVKVRCLDDRESRQLFGAMSIVALHPLIAGTKYPRLLEFAIKQPGLFSSRVAVPPDIVSNPKQFLESLFKKLPNDERDKIEVGMDIGLRLLLQSAYEVVGIRPKSSAFLRAFAKGEPVEVEMRLNGVSRKSGLLRINRDTIVLGQKEMATYCKRKTYPSLNIGEVILDAVSERNIANVANSRVDDVVPESYSRILLMRG